MGQWKDIVPTSRTEPTTEGDLICGVPGYRLEAGGVPLPTTEAWYLALNYREIVNSGMDYPFFEEKILPSNHKNYICLDGRGNLVVISMMMEKASPYLILVQTLERSYQLVVSSEHKPKDVLKSLSSHFAQYQFGGLHSVKSVESEILLRLERSYRVNSYKFGVLYCRDGQTDENDMFANTLISKDYETFLGWLGEEITLEGWNRFRGGLDVARNSTGLRSIFTTYRSYEIMFHVATMLSSLCTKKAKENLIPLVFTPSLIMYSLLYKS